MINAQPCIKLATINASKIVFRLATHALRVSPSFANLFNDFEAPSGNNVPFNYDSYEVIFHVLFYGGSSKIGSEIYKRNSHFSKI